MRRWRARSCVQRLFFRLRLHRLRAARRKRIHQDVPATLAATAALTVAALGLALTAALASAALAIASGFKLHRSVEQRLDVHGRHSRAVHLLHNNPGPMRCLSPRAEQLPDLVRLMSGRDLVIASAALKQLHQSDQQRRRQSHAVHLLHNEPGPMQFQSRRAEQLPGLMPHMPGHLHGHVHLRLRW
jgi:hypothetical protein